MDRPAQIARAAGLKLSTVDAECFELCFDLHGADRLLATFFWDGKPQNAYNEVSDSDAPVGWCIQYSDELRGGELVAWQFRAPANALDVATAMACGMVQQRLLKKGWWKPLPDHRLWEADNPGQVKGHHRFEIDPPPRGVKKGHTHLSGLLRMLDDVDDGRRRPRYLAEYDAAGSVEEKARVTWRHAQRHIPGEVDFGDARTEEELIAGLQEESTLPWPPRKDRRQQ